MQINTDYYGTERSTVYDDVKYTTYTIASGLNNGDLPFNEQFDLSICPWRIGSGSDIFKMYFPILYTEDTSPSAESDWIYDKHPLFDGSDGYLFYFAAEYGAYTRGQRVKTIWWDGRSMPNTTGEILPSGNNAMRDTNIITDFDYSKLCYSVILHTSAGYKTLDDALGYFDPETYDPDAQNAFQVYGIAFAPNYWNGTGFVSPDWSMCALNMGQPYGGGNTDSQYDEEWFDPCVNVNPGNYLALGGQRWATPNGRGYRYGFSRGGESNARINQEYWIYDLNNPKSVNYPQRDIYEYAMWFQGGDNWEMKVYRYDGYDGWSLIAYTYARLKLENFSTVDEFADYVRTQAAYIGCYFVTDQTTPSASRYPLKNNPDVYLSEITAGDQAITTGAYRKGTEQSEFENSQWTTDPWSHTPDPSFIPDRDPTPWDPTQTSVISSSSGDPAYGTIEYLMTGHALSELCKVLNYFKVVEAEAPVNPGLCEKLFGTSDPMEAIVSVVKYPFGMVYNWLGDSYQQVVPGTYVTSLLEIAFTQLGIDTTGSGTDPAKLNLNGTSEIYAISWSQSQWVYGTGRIPYFNKYKCFLDYDPYCSASLYVPFCGSVRLDPEVFTGHSIGVRYIVSPLDGSIKAQILRDDLVIDTLTGNMGASIEFDTSDIVQRADTIHQANAVIQAQKMNIAKQAASFIAGAATAGITGGATAPVKIAGGAIASALDISQTGNTIAMAEYQLRTAETPFKQLQTGSGFLAAADEWALRLVAYRPEPLSGYSFDDWGDYGHITGFACMITGTLSQFTGFTVCSDVDTSGIECTAMEKQMIKELLQSGVYF